MELQKNIDSMKIQNKKRFLKRFNENAMQLNENTKVNIFPCKIQWKCNGLIDSTKIQNMNICPYKIQLRDYLVRFIVKNSHSFITESDFGQI